MRYGVSGNKKLEKVAGTCCGCCDDDANQFAYVMAKDWNEAVEKFLAKYPEHNLHMTVRTCEESTEVIE